jgi:hypothetical protein
MNAKRNTDLRKRSVDGPCVDGEGCDVTLRGRDFSFREGFLVSQVCCRACLDH